jgi:type IV secretory pathway TrbL component
MSWVWEQAPQRPASSQALSSKAAVVTTVGNGLQPALAHRIARRQRDRAQLRAVTAVVRDLVGHDQMILGVYRCCTL